MNRLFILAILFFTITTLPCRAQNKYDRVWIFGDSAGIDFNDLDTPVSLKTNCSANQENYASVSDKSGNFQFYVHGYPYGPLNSLSVNFLRIFDHTDQLMCNGDSIITNFTTTQGSLILPSSITEGKYFLFNVHWLTDLPIPIAFRYSIVDMNLNNGNGCVTDKNVILLEALLTEKLQAVKHANGIDWWIIVTGGYGSDACYEFLLSDDIFIGPFVQNLRGFASGEGAGQMKVSQDGSMLAIASSDTGGIIDLYNFDRCTGTLSFRDSINLQKEIGYGNFYGCEFSPNGNYLYVSYPYEFYDQRILQYNLGASNITGSKKIVLNYIQENDSFFKVFGQLQLAPNGKIYCAMATSFPLLYPGQYIYYLASINSPNEEAPFCDAQIHGIDLLGSSTGGLPNMPNYNLGPIIPPMVDAGANTETCAGVPVQLQAVSSSTCIYNWQPPEFLSNSNIANPIATVNETTTFTLTVTDTSIHVSCNKTSIDTVTVFVTDNTPAVQTLYVVPSGDEFFLLQDLQPNTSLEVISVNGQRIYQTDNYQNDLALKNLAAGMYYYKMNLPDCYEVKGKFVVLR